MGDQARNYSRGTRTALAVLSRGVCYHPDCQRPIVVFQDGEPYNDFHVAHVYDANEGNRYRENMSDDERRDFSNLILLCKPHHDLVDKRHPERYPAEVLLGWKATREAEGVAPLSAPGTIKEDDLEVELPRAAIEIHDSIVTLGGQGGSAPGAGGGGGGVIGDGIGGPGGPGGNFALNGTDATAPGAGGGGGGAVGPDPFGGEGGGGGEYVVGLLNLEEGEQLRFHVGEGGKEGRAGEDTYVEVIGLDGNVRDVIRASGGIPGRSGAALRDLRDGPSVRIEAAFLCEAAQIKYGLLNVWSGGCDYFRFAVLPAPFGTAFAVVAEVVVPGPRDTELQLDLIDSDGVIRASDPYPLAYDAGPKPHRINIVHAFTDHEVTKPGTWRIRISSAGQLLSETEFRLEVESPEPANLDSAQSETE